MNKYPDVTYQAINVKGEESKNVGDNDINAVTWGVFRGKEVVQPTVVDHQAFKIWKDEAFKTWIDTWAKIYQPQKDKDGNETSPGSPESIAFLQKCHDELYLMNIVDNDYVEGDLAKVLSDFIDENQDLIKSL